MNTFASTCNNCRHWTPVDEFRQRGICAIDPPYQSKWTHPYYWWSDWCVKFEPREVETVESLIERAKAKEVVK